MSMSVLPLIILKSQPIRYQALNATDILPQRHQILNHFFPQVMIDAVNLLFREQRCQVIGQLLRALQVPSERFLDYDPGPSP